MKTVIIILMFALLSYGKSASHQDSIQLNSFIRDFSGFVNRPMNWCTLDVVDYSTDKTYYSDSITIEFELQVFCDERIVMANFKNFIAKYQTFMDAHDNVGKHDNLIDNTISELYPDMQLVWSNVTNGYGRALNSDTVAYIELSDKYGASLSNDKKTLFYTLKIGNYVTSPIRATLMGNMLDTRNSMIKKETLQYRVNVSKSAITEQDVNNMKVRRVWHLESRQSYISALN